MIFIFVRPSDFPHMIRTAFLAACFEAAFYDRFPLPFELVQMADRAGNSRRDGDADRVHGGRLSD